MSKVISNHCTKNKGFKVRHSFKVMALLMFNNKKSTKLFQELLKLVNTIRFPLQSFSSLICVPNT